MNNVSYDNGSHSSSPHYKYESKCPNCKEECDETTEYEYCIFGEEEDAPTHFITVCEFCETYFLKDEKNILV